MEVLSDEDFLMRVNSVGRVTWTPGGIFETSCEADVTYYPMDIQECRYQTVALLKPLVNVIIIPGYKRLPVRHPYSFWSFEVSEGILRNQNIIIGLHSLSNQRLERGGVVVRRTPNGEVLGSIPTGVTVLLTPDITG